MTNRAAVKTKEETKTEYKKKSLVDKDTIFHLLFGCCLGLVLGWLINNFNLAFIFGIILIPILEYITHRIAVGHATLFAKNSLVDLFFAALGLLVILIILQFLYHG